MRVCFKIVESIDDLTAFVPSKLFSQKKKKIQKSSLIFSTVTPPRDEIQHPCAANPCGANAVCTERNGAGACKCLPDYFGDPYSGCRPECVANSDCPSHFACLNNKCKDPCPGVCALNAECHVVHHAPQCSCMIGYVGNPLTGCHREVEQPPPSKTQFFITSEYFHSKMFIPFYSCLLILSTSNAHD